MSFRTGIKGLILYSRSISTGRTPAMATASINHRATRSTELRNLVSCLRRAMGEWNPESEELQLTGSNLHSIVIKWYNSGDRKVVLLKLRAWTSNLVQLYLVKINNMQLNVNFTWSSLLWNENSGSAPLLSNFLAASTTEWIQVLRHVDTHTHRRTHRVRLQCDTGRGCGCERGIGDGRGHWRMFWVVSVLITIIWTFTLSSLRPEPPKVSLKWFFFLVCCAAGSGKCGRRENAAWSLAAWLFLTARWGCAGLYFSPGM